jgi:hypothetical protein
MATAAKRATPVFQGSEPLTLFHLIEFSASGGAACHKIVKRFYS